MPFLGCDWRSPGEQWVKTDDGWERLKMWRFKLLENLSENAISRLMKFCSSNAHLNEMQKPVAGCSPQPFVLIFKHTTKEQKMQISISEAFTRLDMLTAVKDVRRFNYVHKLLEVLLTNKLPSLSGSAQKYLFNLLEVMVNTVSKTQCNVLAVHTLLQEAQKSLENGRYTSIGGTHLWERHLAMVERMDNKLCNIDYNLANQNTSDSDTHLSDLPEDCLYQIIKRLTCHTDIIHTGLIDARAHIVSQERRIWKALCLFHFDNQQITSIIGASNVTMLEDMDTEGWQKLYLRLVKRYGRRDIYAEMLSLCRQCNALYWQDHGHPCPVDEGTEQYIPVTPVMCIDLLTG